MSASAQVDPHLLVREIVISAGADPVLASMASGILTCPDIEQIALDTAIANYNESALQSLADRRKEVEKGGTVMELMDDMIEVLDNAGMLNGNAKTMTLKARSKDRRNMRNK